MIGTVCGATAAIDFDVDKNEETCPYELDTPLSEGLTDLDKLEPVARETVDRLEALGVRLRGQHRNLALELIDAADLGGGTARAANEYEVRELTRDTRTILHRLRAHDGPFPVRGHERSQAERELGAQFARAALLTWA